MTELVLTLKSSFLDASCSWEVRHAAEGLALHVASNKAGKWLGTIVRWLGPRSVTRLETIH